MLLRKRRLLDVLLDRIRVAAERGLEALRRVEDDRERGAREQHAHRAPEVLALRIAFAARRAGRRARSAASAPRRRPRTRASAAPLSTPILCCAESAVIVASTGPAHGTKTRPRLTPSTNPPPRSPPRRRVMNASGRSSRYANRGKSSDAASTNSSAIARLRSTSCGSPSAERIDAAASVNSVKLATRPGDDRERPAARAARTAGEHDRQHREDARRHRGDDTCEETDAEQDEHRFQAYSAVLTRRLNSAPQRGRSEPSARAPSPGSAPGVLCRPCRDGRRRCAAGRSSTSSSSVSPSTFVPHGQCTTFIGYLLVG